MDCYSEQCNIRFVIRMVELVVIYRDGRMVYYD